MSVIYKITDSDGKFYIGSTTNLKRKLKEHSLKQTLCLGLKQDWKCDILEETDLVGNDLKWIHRKYYDEHYGDSNFMNKQIPIQTKEEKNAKYQCPCGSIISGRNRKAHESTDKHVNYMDGL